MSRAIRDAIVPVAGLGTRLLPATRSTPKEMLPIVDTPVVQHVIEELAAAGIERTLMVTGRRKRAIEDHFDADPELGSSPVPASGMRLLYTRQPRPTGLGDAVARGEGFGRGGPEAPGVVVALGDAIIEPAPGDRPGVVQRLIDAHERHRADAAVAVVEVPAADIGRYGIVSGAPLQDGVLAVSAIAEKPAPGTTRSRLAVAARYVLGPAVFAALRTTDPDGRGEVQLTDALAAVVAGGGQVIAVKLADGERRHDIGSVHGYCETFLRFALRHPELGPSLRAHAATLLDED